MVVFAEDKAEGNNSRENAIRRKERTGRRKSQGRLLSVPVRDKTTRRRINFPISFLIRCVLIHWKFINRRQILYYILYYGLTSTRLSKLSSFQRKTKSSSLPQKLSSHPLAR